MPASRWASRRHSDGACHWRERTCSVCAVTKTHRALNAARLRVPESPPQAIPAQVMRRFVSQPGFLLARINQIYVALHNEASMGRTPAQSELLLLLEGGESLSQATLARAAGLDTSTTALVSGQSGGAGSDRSRLGSRRPTPLDSAAHVRRPTATAGTAGHFSANPGTARRAAEGRCQGRRRPNAPAHRLEPSESRAAVGA